MRDAIKALDRILRGEATRLPTLQQGRFEVPLGQLALVIVVLAGLYGICMGVFAMLQPQGAPLMQAFASMIKVPLLFLLTLVITFPSLYVFNALVGSQLSLPSVLKLLIAALGVTTAVLASLGPIEAFFAVSTTSYDFMVLLNVLIFAVAGFLGLAFLLQTLHRLTVAQVIQSWQEEPPPSAESADPVELPEPPGGPEPISPRVAPRDFRTHQPDGPLDRLEGHILGSHTRLVFRIWVIVFGLVGAQLGWILRPFIGDPNRPFEWFRERDSNFFEAVFRCIANLF